MSPSPFESSARPAFAPPALPATLPVPARVLHRAATLSRVARAVPATDHPVAAARALRTALRQIVTAHGLEIRRHGEWPAGPALIIANHLGYLDPVVIGSLLPCAPVAKAEVFEWPFIGRALARGGGIRVVRGDVASGAAALRAIRARLAAGVSVLVFPEGTTTRGPAPAPFRAGAIAWAARLGLPVVPVGLAYDEPTMAWVDDEAFFAHYLRTAAGARHGVSVRVGPALRCPPGAGPEALARRARAAVAALCPTR